jgi:hypothetical protein
MPKLKLLREAYQPKESEIKNSIRKYLALRGIFCFNQWQGQFSVPGVPDLIGLIPGSGRMLAIEVKRPGHNPTDKQQAFLDQINKHGGVAFVATSVEEVERKLEIR